MTKIYELPDDDRLMADIDEKHHTATISVYELDNLVRAVNAKDMDYYKALAAQRILMDNGIEASETGVVLETIIEILLDKDIVNLIEWDKDKIPYKEDIWEEYKYDLELGRDDYEKE